MRWSRCENECFALSSSGLLNPKAFSRERIPLKKSKFWFCSITVGGTGLLKINSISLCLLG